MTGNSLAVAARRFIVWRTYHQLAERLGRLPTTCEIGAECDIHPAQVRYHIKTLSTCRFRRPGPPAFFEDGRIDPPSNVERTLDVVEFMERESR